MSNTNFVSRAYNSFEKLPGGILLKKSKSDRLVDEIKYYLSIPPNLENYFPRMFKSSLAFDSNQFNRMWLEYYPYPTLGSLLIGNSPCNWDDIFDQLKEVMSQFQTEFDTSSNDVTKFSRQMYIEKTEREFANWMQMCPDICSTDGLTINGKTYLNFHKIWPVVKEYIEQNMLSYISTMIHGDMCFSNILYHPEVGPRFIDMRGSFGKPGIYGDIRYDVAKLLHSLDGSYEYFINQKFDLTQVSNSEYTLNVWQFINYSNTVRHEFNERILSNFNQTQIKIIQGTIFVGMCARHFDSEIRQRALYLTGIRILNEGMNL
jgi:hypothetical protein